MYNELKCPMCTLSNFTPNLATWHLPAGWCRSAGLLNGSLAGRHTRHPAEARNDSFSFCIRPMISIHNSSSSSASPLRLHEIWACTVVALDERWAGVAVQRVYKHTFCFKVDSVLLQCDYSCIQGQAERKKKQQKKNKWVREMKGKEGCGERKTGLEQTQRDGWGD